MVFRYQFQGQYIYLDLHIGSLKIEFRMLSPFNFEKARKEPIKEAKELNDNPSGAFFTWS